MGALIVSALVAITSVNVAAWWMWGRKKDADLRAARAHNTTLRSLKNWWQTRAVIAEGAVVAASRAEVAARSEVTATLLERMGGQR
jgi:hypothetical protein